MLRTCFAEVLEGRLVLAVSLISVDTSGGFGDGSFSGSGLSHDGRYVAFTSGASDLVANDANQRDDIFIRDRQLNATTLVNVDGDEEPLSVEGISGDGSVVLFSRARAGSDGFDGGDIFVTDVAAGTTSLVTV